MYQLVGNGGTVAKGRDDLGGRPFAGRRVGHNLCCIGFSDLNFSG